MQLQTIKNKLKRKCPGIIFTTGGKSDSEQNTYATFGDYTSCILEDLKTGVCRIVDDHLYISPILA